MVEEARVGLPLFSLEGRWFDAKVLDAYDADTLTVALELESGLHAFKVRLAGVDAPEMRPPRSRPGREQEKRAAVRARNTLVGWVTSGERPDPERAYTRRELRRRFFEPNRAVVRLKAGPFDKYGRLLGEVYVGEGQRAQAQWGGGDDESVNSRLVKEGFARPYDGGARRSWAASVP